MGVPAPTCPGGQAAGEESSSEEDGAEAMAEMLFDQEFRNAEMSQFQQLSGSGTAALRIYGPLSRASRFCE